MFKMKLSTPPHLLRSAPAPAIVQPQVQSPSSGNLTFANKGGVSRTLPQMNMNIANLKASRGCSSCGK